MWPVLAASRRYRLDSCQDTPARAPRAVWGQGHVTWTNLACRNVSIPFESVCVPFSVSFCIAIVIVSAVQPRRDVSALVGTFGTSRHLVPTSAERPDIVARRRADLCTYRDGSCMYSRHDCMVFSILDFRFVLCTDATTCSSILPTRNA